MLGESKHPITGHHWSNSNTSPMK